MECLAHHYTERTNCCQAVGTSQGFTTTLHWAQIVDYCKWSSHEILLKTEVQKERGDETKLPCCLAIANRVSNETKLLHYLDCYFDKYICLYGCLSGPVYTPKPLCESKITIWSCFLYHTMRLVFLPRISANHRYFYNVVSVKVSSFEWKQSVKLQQYF